MAIKLKKTDFVRNLVKNHKLVGSIDKVIGDEEFSWKAEFGPKTGDDGWHPSGHCLSQPNALYAMASAALAGEDPKKPAASLMKSYQVGHFWHAYLQWIIVKKLNYADEAAIERRGYTGWGDEVKARYFGTNGKGPKVTHKPFHYATGAADVAPCSIPVHGEFLVDIKTMGAHDFKQMQLPAWCAGKYEAQINIYMDWFDLERAIILCVQKDSPHAFKEFEFERNQALIDAIYGKWSLVGACLEVGEEPPEDYEVELPLVGPRM